MNKMEQVEWDAYRNNIVADMQSLVEKYRSVSEALANPIFCNTQGAALPAWLTFKISQPACLPAQ